MQGIGIIHERFNILHNDIHPGNIIVNNVSNRAIIINFGKVTPVSNQITYNLTESQKYVYNRNHRHLAHELRNIAGTKQSEATDAYSVGFVVKRIGCYTIPSATIF